MLMIYFCYRMVVDYLLVKCNANLLVYLSIFDFWIYLRDIFSKIRFTPTLVVPVCSWLPLTPQASNKFVARDNGHVLSVWIEAWPRFRLATDGVAPTCAGRSSFVISVVCEPSITRSGPWACRSKCQVLDHRFARQHIRIARQHIRIVCPCPFIQ